MRNGKSGRLGRKEGVGDEEMKVECGGMGWDGGMGRAGRSWFPAQTMSLLSKNGWKLLRYF